jgi:PcaR/PcaU/PobR family beta-ketoadipate pathway transcriptional regulator
VVCCARIVNAPRARQKRSDARNTSGGIQSVQRALTILELFSDRQPALSVSEVAELTGLNRATCYRFCQTLRQLGYLEEVHERRFRPGLKAVSLAHSALRSRELPELAMPYLRELRREVDETVNMGLLDGKEVVYVARVLSDHLISLRLYVGSRLPAYASSLGRAMLAFLPEDESRTIIEHSELKRLTENTIVDPRRLTAELRRIRSQGYVVNNQEIATGLYGVAAPVLSASQRPIAAVNISIPRPVTDPKEIDGVFAPAVMETANAISALASQLQIE